MGGLFEQLPIPRQGLDFERLFAMPQAVDHEALAAAHGVPTRRGAERLPGRGVRRGRSGQSSNRSVTAPLLALDASLANLPSTPRV